MTSDPLTTSPTNKLGISLIDRVLQLRQQLGITTPLSLSETEGAAFFPPEPREASQESLKQTSSTHQQRDWLSWSQSPYKADRS